VQSEDGLNLTIFIEHFINLIPGVALSLIKYRLSIHG